MFFQFGTAIAKKPLFGIAITKASVNGTIDNIQLPLVLSIANANAIAQCERTLSVPLVVVLTTQNLTHTMTK